MGKNDSPKISLFVPGRLCLFGEHSDWAGMYRTINSSLVAGAAIVTGIEQGIEASAEKADTFSLHNAAPELKGAWTNFECPMEMGELQKVASSGGYFSYVCGVASYMRENYHVGGLKINVKSMTLPVKSGLSSSAAICVLVARAFNQLYELKLSTLGEMTIAFRGEQRTPSRCGRLDQACAFGVQPVCMTFDGEQISVERLVIKNPLYWVFANLNAAKDTIKILADLNKCYPFAQTEREKDVQEALGAKNRAIVNRAIAYLKAGDAKALGELMSEAQHLFDAQVAPASPGELASPRLHQFLGDEKIKALSWGGKGVGSQGDGSIQFLAKDGECQRKLFAYLKDKGLSPFTLTIAPRHRVSKAIIPVAGYGTRLYPMTRFIKKDMVPVVDADGLLKPAILILLEQLYEAEIAEICLVVGSEEEWETYRRYFRRPLPAAHREKLAPEMRAYEEKILSIGDRLSCRIQAERRGFGHAVYQCRDFAGGDPVLLLLGDTIYRGARNCSLQLMEAFNEIEAPMVGIHPVPLGRVGHFGILAGKWADGGERIMRVERFVEKPAPEEARENLATELAGEKKYFAVFGQYILTPEVFAEIEKAADAAKSETCEIGLTEALAQFIARGSPDKPGLAGIRIDGEMFDLGNVEAFKEAASFAEKPV